MEDFKKLNESDKRINEKKTVKVFDAIMGSGKTYDAIERMKGYIELGEKFIYVTPFINEIKRVMEELPVGYAFTPLSREDNNNLGVFQIDWNLIDVNGNYDLNAKKKYKLLNKRTQFLKLAAKGENIITTHALFMDLKKEDYSIFNGYILILDEVINPLTVLNIGAKDIDILRNQEMIVIDEQTNEVRFIDDDYHDSAFKDVKKLCNNTTVFYLDKYFFVWVFPIEIFKQFKQVQVLTYLFESSLLAAYFKMYEVQYDIDKKDSINQLNEYKNLLNIYEGRANQNFSINSFSKTWSENLSKTDARKIVNATSNVFKRVFNTTSDENAYTTFKDFKSKLAGKGYTKGFISINSRASNDYRLKKSMAYLGNKYFDPQQHSFFRERNIKLDEDMWALTELIQWIWRGCIRDKKPMNLFIPNKRMRMLLIRWLNGEFINNGNLQESLIEVRKVG